MAALGRSESADDAPKVPVILLPEDAGSAGQEGAAPQIIVPAGAFGAEQAVAIERDSGTELLVLTKLLESGPGFELYDYTTVS
jgi:hypothetical protein